MDERFSAFSCNMIDRKDMNVKFRGKNPDWRLYPLNRAFLNCQNRTFLISHDKNEFLEQNYHGWIKSC